MYKIHEKITATDAVIIEASETYFFAFNVVKKAIIPAIRIAQLDDAANPQKVATAFPPLNPANNGQQCPSATPNGAR